MTRTASATSPRIASLAIAAGGVALLLARTQLLSLPDGHRAMAVGALFLGVGAAAWLVPGPATMRRLPTAMVLAIGLVGVVVATMITGAPPGLPIGWWTLPAAMLAAVAEELLFRRLLYGALARQSEALAIGITATAFALIHLPLYGASALPVDLGAGLLFSWQRWASGSWTVPAATHAAANLLAVMR